MCLHSRWPLTQFIQIVQMFGLNSYIIKRQVKPNLQHREFRCQLSLGLIARANAQKPRIRRGPAGLVCFGGLEVDDVEPVPDTPIIVGLFCLQLMSCHVMSFVHFSLGICMQIHQMKMTQIEHWLEQISQCESFA